MSATQFRGNDLDRVNDADTDLQLRYRWMAGEAVGGDPCAGREACSGDPCAGREACSGDPCAGREACGGDPGGTPFDGANADLALYTAALGGIPRDGADLDTLLDARERALAI